MKIAFVFPGQGSQSVGMGSQLFSTYPTAKCISENADSILGYSISDICANGPAETLSSTKITQPAIYTTSVATLAVLNEHGIQPNVVAGHSVGEYAALVAAKVISWQDGLTLVQRRATEMQSAANANPGTMAAVLGLDFVTLSQVCKDVESAGQGIVDCANINSEAQIVISGEIDAVAAAGKLASERGAKKIIPLSVSGGFHSRLMLSAANAMRNVIETASIHDSSIPIVANVTGEYEQLANEIKANLVKQIDHSVLWDQSVKKMIANGVDTFVEVGSGKVLSGLLRRVSPDIQVFSTGDAESMSITIAALSNLK